MYEYVYSIYIYICYSKNTLKLVQRMYDKKFLIFFFKKLSLCNQETSYNSATLKHWQIDTLNSLQLC